MVEARILTQILPSVPIILFTMHNALLPAAAVTIALVAIFWWDRKDAKADHEETIRTA
jgi:hypothetical protein